MKENKPNKTNRGRKSKYETVIVPRLDEITEMLKLGATDKEIAETLGINKGTFSSYKKQYSEFDEFIKKGRKKPIIKIKASLFKRATGFEYVEKKVEKHFIEIPKTIKEVLTKLDYDLNAIEQPQITKVIETTKYVVPDPASCMILLKHWAKDEGWTNDPAQLDLKKKELELKQKTAEKDEWL